MQWAAVNSVRTRGIMAGDAAQAVRLVAQGFVRVGGQRFCGLGRGRCNENVGGRSSLDVAFDGLSWYNIHVV